MKTWTASNRHVSAKKVKGFCEEHGRLEPKVIPGGPDPRERTKLVCPHCGRVLNELEEE